MSRMGAETRTRSRSGNGGIEILETAPVRFILSSERAQDSRQVGGAARGAHCSLPGDLDPCWGFLSLPVPPSQWSSAVEVCLSLLTV